MPEQLDQRMSGAQSLVRSLEAAGVDTVFGIPGGAILPAYDPLFDSEKVRHILVRHEQGAGFMAATYGRHTGKTGVCMATLGPGATNFVTAAAYAQLGGMPILMVTGQKPIKKSKQGRFQILDVVAMMDPITKFTHQLASADNIPSRVREAYRLAEEEKPGAVHLELAEDVADERTTSRPIPRSRAGSPRRCAGRASALSPRPTSTTAGIRHATAAGAPRAPSPRPSAACAGPSRSTRSACGPWRFPSAAMTACPATSSSVRMTSPVLMPMRTRTVAF